MVVLSLLLFNTSGMFKEMKFGFEIRMKYEINYPNCGGIKFCVSSFFGIT